MVKIVKKTSLKRPKKKSQKQEITRLGSALRGLGSLGGSTLGSFIGMPTQGADLGKSLGASISKWLGSGDYSVNANTLTNSFKSSGIIPMMHNQKQSIIVRHREFIQDIYSGPTLVSSATSFNVNYTAAINPGLTSSYPWLATIAQQYQEYTIKGMIYHYIPTSGMSVAGANTALGSVMLATNYRATLPAYTSKTYLLNEYFSSDGRPSEAICHPIECDPAENPYNVQYVRTNAVPAGEDPKTYDLGVLSVATQGMQAANTNLGELWCTYEIELRKPVALGLLGTDAAFSTIVRSGIAAGLSPFGTATTSSNASGDLISSVSAQTITFRRGVQGNFQVILIYPASAVTAWSAFGTIETNCSQGNPPFSWGNFSGSTITAASGNMVFTANFSIPDASLQASIFCNSSFFTGTIASCTILAYQVNDLVA